MTKSLKNIPLYQRNIIGILLKEKNGVNIGFAVSLLSWQKKINKFSLPMPNI